MNQQPLPLHTAAHAATEARLLDECRAAEAILYGKRMELALHAGLRDDARYWKESMEKVIRDRRDAALGAAERAGQDFFVAAGRMDAAELLETVHGR